MNTLYIVNTMNSARPASRALGLKLVHQERGAQYYRPKYLNEERPFILMTSARGNAIDVSLRTAHLLGAELASTAAGTFSAADTPKEAAELQQRLVLLLCEDESIESPAVGIRIQGSLLDRPYYPDVLAASHLPERALDSPEAAGFAAAVLRLCGPHEVLIGVVPANDSAAAQRNAVADFALLAESTMRKRPATFHFERDEWDALGSCVTRLGFSTAERTRLEQAARAARIRGASQQTIIHLLSEANHAKQLISQLERTHTV